MRYCTLLLCVSLSVVQTFQALTQFFSKLIFIMPLTAVSPDKSILAVYNNAQASSSSKILIKCYDAKVSLGTLKFTLSANNEKGSSTINRIAFASSQFLVASTEEGSMLVFDLHRGVLSQTVEVSSSQGKVACIATHNDRLYALSNKDGKTLVLVYDLSQNAKIIKKIKTGSCDQDEPLAIDVASGDSDSTLVAVRLGKKIKLVDSNNGSVLGKFKIKTSDSEAVDSPFVRLSPDAKFLVANSSNNLYYFAIDGNGECNSLGTSALPNINSADIFVDDESSRYVVSVTDQSTASLLSIKAAGGKKTNVKPFAFLSQPVPKDNTVIDAFFSSEEVVMVELTTKGFQNVSVDLARLSWNGASGNVYPVEEVKENEDDTSPSKKRKANNKSVVIGPGESGGEALTVTDSTKRTKIDHDGDDSADEEDEFVLEDDDDEEGENTIGQRLALLSSELDRDDDEEDLLKFQRSTAASGSFVAKAATSDSLVILLRQALLANDDAQLEVALQVSDKKVIENSIMALSSGEGNSDDESDNGEVIVMLLTKLVTRLSRKPARAQQLSFWIRTVLVALISSSNDGTMKMGKAEKDIASRLAPLRSLLSERVESLPALLRLEGRLGLLGKQF